MFVTALYKVYVPVSGHSTALEIMHLWKFTSGFIGPQILYITRASKRNIARRNIGAPWQIEISLKIEDLRSNKTTGKLS
jgi:hypothetical protein